MITRLHKEIAIGSLYGFMEGNGRYLEYSVMERFRHNNLEPIHVEFKAIRQMNNSNKTPPNDFDQGCWGITLTSDNETYEVIRDFQEEWRNDRQHKNYDDEYFYDSDDCYKQIKYKELMNML